MSIFNRSSGSTPLGKLLSNISAKQARSGASNGVTAKVSQGVASIESLGGDEQAQIQSVQETVATDLREAVQDTDAETGETGDTGYAGNPEALEVGIESASIIALVKADPSAYFAAGKKAVGVEGLASFGAMGSGPAGTIAFAQPAVESFDKQKIESFMEYSIAYNLLAPRQDAFGEALFPTIVGTPDQAYFKVGIERTMVYQGAVHKLNGDIAKFDKRNLIEAFRNAELLENESTVLVPFVQPDLSNADHFVLATDVANTDRLVDGIAITTRPLKMNAAKPVSLLGICQSPALVAAGLLDQSDAVDHNAKLHALYVKVTNTDTSEVAVLKFDTSRMPKNQFIKTREGHGRDAALRFASVALKIDGTKKAVDGSTVAFATALGAANQVLRLRVRVDGDLNLERSDLEMRASGLQPDTLRSTVDGSEVVVDSSAILADLTFEVIGYDLDARRTNSNRRSRGLLLDKDFYEEIYQVGLLPPMSIQKPATHDDGPVDLQSLINATHMRISNLAVTTLINYAESLKAIVEEQTDVIDTSTASSITGGDFEGIARLLVTPFYEYHEIDLEEVINNITSADKLKDISGYFTGFIQEIAYRMAQRSGYQPALEVANSGSNIMPELIIATDNVLPQFIMIQGDDRTAGPSMTHKLVGSPDSRMIGNIYLTFGTKSGGKFDPLHFGNLIWIPELVSSIPVNRTGSTVEETMVQPRFRHIVNLPVMAHIKVLNLNLVLKGRTAINFLEV